MSKATPKLLTEDFTAPALPAKGSLKGTLKSKLGLSVSIPEAIGAIVIGVIVLGGAGFGIAAGYNYSQDNTAKSDLEAVSSAQILFQSKTGAFAANEDLLITGDTPALTSKPEKLKVVGTDTNYCAVVQSKSMSGPSFWVTAKSSEIRETKPSATEAGVTCPDAS